MRSDKNPYHFLIKSKNAQVQMWLEKASHMSKADILLVNVKPDLKKAMLYLADMQTQQASAGVAESIATQMAQAHAPSTIQLQIYEYLGSTMFIPVSHMSQMEIKQGQFFAVRENRTFVSNCWSPMHMNPLLLSQSKFICQADATKLNQLNQQRLKNLA
jgi:hypothetical protein